MSDLTGLELANASLLDEATAAAEAMAMCRRVSKNPSPVFLVSRDCFPQTIEVLRTRAEPLGIEIVLEDPQKALEQRECFGLLLQYPTRDGEIFDYTDAIKPSVPTGRSPRRPPRCGFHALYPARRSEGVWRDWPMS